MANDKSRKLNREAAKQITQEESAKILESLYKRSLEGILKVSPPIDVFANNYLDKNGDPRSAAKAMLKNQVIKCTTSGFVNGFGGFLTMPITIPANLTSVLYIQMRMVACAAYLGGYDLHDDQVQTFVYACLAGVAVNEIFKKFGAQFGQKLAVQGIKKIPGRVFTKINQRLGFRFITKFGEKGLINLGKMVPAVGAGINGGFDFIETKAIAARAYKMFLEGDFSVGEPLNIDEINDIVEVQSEETDLHQI